MSKCNTDDFWTCMLLINNTSDRFIVIPNSHKDAFPKERWELPKSDDSIPEATVVDMAIWLAETYLHLKIKEKNLRLRCTVKYDSGFKVHLFENNSLTAEINDLFENEMSKGWYQTMSYHQAGLIHSGLDSLQKEILAKANLIRIYTSSLGRHLKPVRKDPLLKNFVGFSPRPL